LDTLLFLIHNAILAAVVVLRHFFQRSWEFAMPSKSPSKTRRAPVSTDRRFRSLPTSADYGPLERWQHSGRTFEPTERAGMLAARATEEHVIDVLVLRGFLEKSQSDAAFRFKNDYQHAGLAPQLIGCYSPAKNVDEFYYTGRERSDPEEAAYYRWRHAVRMLGMLLSGTIISVVCYDRLPMPQDMLRLRQGLIKLAAWYGISQEETPIATPQSEKKSGENIDQTTAR
jgi:hypothetical protein